ncbi:MAG: type II CAAX endopeptidase family protein [Chloroflexaceae bacterium]
MDQKWSKTTERFPWQFILLAFTFSWLFWIPGALAAYGVAVPQELTRFLNSPFNPAAFGPSLAGILLTLKEQGWSGVGRLLKQGINIHFNKIWLLPILFLPLLIFAGATLLSVIIGKTTLDLSVLANPPLAIVAPIMILLTAGPLQEEFGWRGYALPRLQRRFNALMSSIILGIVWWLWHFPLVFIPGRFMVNNVLLFGMLMIEIVLMSILFTWIYNNTGGSVLAALLFHTSMNWSIWVLLPGMQVNAVIIGFTSLLLFIIVVIVLSICGVERLVWARSD